MSQEILEVLERDHGKNGEPLTLQPDNREDHSLGEVEQFIDTWRKQIHSKPLLMSKADNETANRLLPAAHEGIICTRKINHVRYLNKYFESINRSLLDGGLYIGCVETNYQLRERLKNKYPRFILYPFNAVHFLVRRVLPKWAVSKRLYFWITRGKNRVISLTEVLGRLVSCGFEIKEYRSSNGQTWFAVTKSQKPAYDMHPTYGPLVRLRRIGKDGKFIHIYKFRTMHPFAEYLQGYIYENNNLQDGGKFDNDMRITGWGKVMRKLWLDEQPMWWNFLKRDLKLVGVRPLSRHYFSLYPEDVQKLRTQFRPGLIPPFYYDLPKTFDEIVASERRYLEAYARKPLRTDIRYLFGSLKNIFIKRAVSN